MTETPTTVPSNDGSQHRGFGVDVGGSGVKGGIVDLDTGQLIGERFKLPTPQPSTPDAVAKTIAAVVREFGWEGGLGVTYPGVVTEGIVRTAANVDKGWIGTNAQKASPSRSSTTPTPQAWPRRSSARARTTPA
jgi:polyphosphate glucokinase